MDLTVSTRASLLPTEVLPRASLLPTEVLPHCASQPQNHLLSQALCLISLWTTLENSGGQGLLLFAPTLALSE